MLAYTPYLILFLPLLAAVSIRFFLHPFPRISLAVSTLACFGSFLGALAFLVLGSTQDLSAVPSLPWIELAGFRANFGILGDPLARGMAVLVSGVAFLVHLYSIAYLQKDPSRSRFFAELSLFVFSMLGIVLADNLISMFICWELVGLSSY
jgi:NADH-quinone oxidoreductase subunit L